MVRDLKIKVCGMRDVENIGQLVLLKPDYIGFIFYPGSKRFVEHLSSAALDQIPDIIKKTGVFVDASHLEIADKIKRYSLEAVQLHGQETPELCSQLRSSGIEVIKAFGISNHFDFDQLDSYESAVDYFLFDTKTEQHGGSGQTFNWQILQEYHLTKPYFLSGGLSADNINEVCKLNDPRLYAVDLNSRFELEPGLKDINKLASVFNELKIPV